MAEVSSHPWLIPPPTAGEPFKAKAITDGQVNALSDAVPTGKLDEQAELAKGYLLDGHDGQHLRYFRPTR